MGSRAEGGVASKLGDETRLMTMKGGTVLDSVKMLACMLGGCNIGLQWSINGVLIETFLLVMGSRAEGDVASVGRNPTEWSGDAASEGWAEHQQEVDWAGAMQAQL